MRVPAWLLKVLEEKCSTLCLDTPEERLVCATHIADVMADELCKELGLTRADKPRKNEG